MNKYAIIVAGGAGRRMGSNLPKQFLPLHNKPVLWYSINAFCEAYKDIKIIVVLPEAYLDTGRSIIQSIAHGESIITVKGGNSRFESVKNGLGHVPMHAIVFIHDGVRCLVTPGLIQSCYETALQKGNAIPAIKAVDTLRMETPGGNKTIDRNTVKIIQTPQTFLSNVVKEAFAQDYQESFTDDASVIESCGHNIHLVEGEITNLKITTQTDLLIAEKIIEKRLRQ